ncbi:MAG TPA: ester cyclase [Chloroflexota bacterium]
MASTSTTHSLTPEVEANIALVRRFYEEIVNRQNTAILSDFIAPNFVDHIPHPLPVQPKVGHEAIRWFVETARTAVPDLQVDIEDVIAAGDKVVTRVLWHGTQQGRLLGADPTGKKVRFMGIDIARIANGKIVEHWGQIDVLRAIDQLGFMPV